MVSSVIPVSCPIITYWQREPLLTLGMSAGVDPVRQPHYIGTMTKKTSPVIMDQQLAQLEEKVDSLLDIISRLMRENQSLRAQQVTQATERAGLVERHDEVRNRVEAIVSRLKSLETNI